MADETICPKCSAQNPKDTVFCGKCGTKIPQSTAEQQAIDPLIGSFVGDRFLVHQKLGEGGMGVVYRAEQTAIKREVALKVLHANLTDESLFARFQNEAAAASRLNHPNTITIYDFGKTESNSLYIAMEYIKGISLDDEIRNIGGMPVERACRIGVQICGSLQDAHDNSIVHRDLKPENVMLCERAGETDVVKVLDFGIAKIVEDDGQDQRKALTKTGMVFGTPQYMSPEQIRGEKVDHRSDIYSLGVMLYQMLTGDLPFTADTPMGLLTKHLMDTPRPLEPHGVPHEVADVVMAALEKEADSRPESMKTLGAMLAAAAGIGTETAQLTAAGQVVPKTQPQRTVQAKSTHKKPAGRIEHSTKKKFPVVPVVIIVLLLAGGGAAALYFTIGQKKPPQTQVVTPPAMTPPAQPEALARLGGQQQQQPVQQPPSGLPAAMPGTATTPVNVGSPSDDPASSQTGGQDQSPPKKDPPAKKPEKKPPEKKDPKPPKKEVNCTFSASPKAGSVGKAVSSALKKEEDDIKACTDKSSSINAIMAFTVKKSSKRLSEVSGKGPGADCIKQRLMSISIKPKNEELKNGKAIFRLVKEGGKVVECKVVVSSVSATMGGHLKSIQDKLKSLKSK